MNLIANLWRSLKCLAGAWNDFWFAPEDPLSLGVLRVLVGGMLTYTHFVWGLNLEGFFGPEGWQSTEAVRGFFEDDWLPSLWWFVPVEHLRLVHVLCLVPLVLFMLGIVTPATSVMALAITISNSNRAPLANYGLDQILSLLTLYLVIGGSGDACSFDAWRRRKRSSAGAAAAEVDDSAGRRATSRARLGTRLIQVHFCVIYFFAGTAKLQGESWWNGEAIWRAIANQEYQSIDMTWLAHYPWILDLATHVTNFWEISFAFLIWNRTLRPFILAIGVAVHAGIGLCMGMITFGSIMIFGYIAFVPPEMMQRMLDFLRYILTFGRSPLHPPRSVHPIFVGSTARAVDPPAQGKTPEEVPNQAEESPQFPIDEPIHEEAPADVSTSEAEPAEMPAELPAPETHPVADRNGRQNQPEVLATETTTRRDTEPTQKAPASDPDEKPSIAICDPDWKYRAFAHYLAHREFPTYVGTSPVRIWRFVETHHVDGAVFFVDRLDSREFELLLDDLTLSPIRELPVVIAVRQQSRHERSLDRQSANVSVVKLPQTFRAIRQELERLIASCEESGDHAEATSREEQHPPREDARESDSSVTQSTTPGETR